MAFARVYDWTDDKDNGVKITASRFDEEMDRYTSNDNLLANSQPQWGGTDTGTASAFAITTTPTPASLQAGRTVRWIAGRDNNGPTATLNDTALGAKPIKMGGTTTINTAAIVSGGIYESVYEGSAFATHRLDQNDANIPVLYVTGTADLLGPLTTIGDATADRLVINAAASAQSVFYFANSVTMNSAVTFNASVTNNAPVTFASGTAHFNATTVIGDATADSLKINATTTAESPWVHNNAVTFNSSATFNGSATIGDATADTLTVNASAQFFSPINFLNSVIFSSGTTFNGNAGAVRTKRVTLTRDFTTASGSVAYTGAGFTPTSILFIAGESGSEAATIAFADPSRAVGALFRRGSTGTWGVDGTDVNIMRNGTGDHQSFTVSSFDSDGFTLAWTKSGTPTGTITVQALCFR